MRTIAEPMANHLAGEVTTLADAWILRRSDGAVFGFTDHDRPIAVAGVLCSPVAGFDPSAARRNAGFAAGDEELSGALSSDLVNEADLEAGLWDGATIEVHLVNWQAPEQSLLLRTGRLGEVTSSDGAFKAEVRGPAAALDQPTGRLYQRACDADFGDDRCGVALALWSMPAVVAAGADARTLFVGGVADRPAGWFGGGTLTIGDGALAGRSATIDEHIVDALGVRLVLRRPLTAVLPPGTALTLVAGCDKQFASCRDRFVNADNFRGFPHMPGRDFVFSYATGGGDDAEVLF